MNPSEGSGAELGAKHDDRKRSTEDIIGIGELDGPPPKRQRSRSCSATRDVPEAQALASNVEQIEKRKPGRPPKKARAGGRPKSTARNNDNSELEEQTGADPIRKARGRPKKTDSPSQSTTTTTLVSTASATVPALAPVANKEDSHARVSALPVLSAITEESEPADHNFSTNDNTGSMAAAIEQQSNMSSNHFTDMLDDYNTESRHQYRHTGNKEYYWLARSSEQAAFAPVKIPPFTDYKEFREIILKEFDVRPSKAAKINLMYRTGTNATKANSQLMRLSSDLDFNCLLTELAEAQKKKKDKYVWIIENVPQNTVCIPAKLCYSYILFH